MLDGTRITMWLNFCRVSFKGICFCKGLDVFILHWSIQIISFIFWHGFFKLQSWTQVRSPALSIVGCIFCLVDLTVQFIEPNTIFEFLWREYKSITSIALLRQLLSCFFAECLSDFLWKIALKAVCTLHCSQRQILLTNLSKCIADQFLHE